MGEPGKQPLILVVDDDPTVRALAAGSLESDGMAVSEAGNANEVLGWIRNHTPDLILLDVRMPGMSGFDLCRELRSHAATAQVPILIMTGLEDTESIREAYSAGATDFVTKPVRGVLLVQRVRYMLRGSRVLAELRASERRLFRAQELARLGHWALERDSDVFHWSEALERMLGMSRGLAATGDQMLDLIHADDRTALQRAVGEVLETGERRTASARFLRTSPPDERHAQILIEPWLDDEGALIGVEGVAQDITERKRVEARASYLAQHDALTGLSNRELFMDLLRRSASRHDQSLALLHVDLDRFYQINESLGHGAGDEVLQYVAERLRRCVRPDDHIARLDGEEVDAELARLGGDEFMVLLAGIRSGVSASLVARRLLREISRPLQVRGREVVITASIGIATWPTDARDAEELARNAIAATVAAKGAGRARFGFYAPELNEESERRFRVETRLRGALERGDLWLAYQPKLSFGSGRLETAEALLRWTDDELGDVGPSEFVPVAEAAGLIVPIGDWVLSSAWEQLRMWQAKGLGVRRVAVNVSIHQLQDADFAGRVADLLRQSDRPASGLELEVTESVFAEERSSLVARLSKLRQMGVRVALDDFGTGYSSLAYLRELPVDVLKIDRAFIRCMDRDPRAAELVGAMLGMARALGLETVAEGVEEEAQLELLERQGCDAVQGFLIAHPLPAEAFAALLSEQD